ncbi:hypothetical protein [Streptomyces beijiangensis]|uniref:Uncharacterized protein n=1 Tax=Streptomyces beijiangensis TaxID=163361 RepID=A0A939FD36_9ACTN|nr:hypothetical protein [Streptomyces beijiangensis]MBO0515904.1 hypothetical protein [Streptomyces beijiangensis]
MADLRREVAESPLPRLLRASAARQLNKGLRGERRLHEPDVFGAIGVYWAAFADRAQWQVPLADRKGRVATMSVSLDPDQQVSGDIGGPVTGATDGVGDAHSGRIDPWKLSASLRAEGRLLKLCAFVGLLSTIGGAKSWLDPSRWEAGRVMFLPAIAVLIGCHYWSKNIQARARAHLDRQG